MNIVFTNNFKKQYQLQIKRGKNPEKMSEVIKIFVNNETFPTKYKDHSMKGDKIGLRNLHVEPDWILLYKIEEHDVIFMETGTHSDLF